MAFLRCLGIWLCSCLLLVGCAQLPPRSASAPEPGPDISQTSLAKVIAQGAQAHPGLSGIHLIDTGPDAFAARMLLAEAAERTLDLQYYIWRDDVSGNLLLDALRRAADRGVRVRLLLDDLGTDGLDAKLAALDAHPRIEVRLFNPFVQRQAKTLGFMGDFGRLDHRMHSKSFTADGSAAVVGGRNVADEYFGASAQTLFVDLDALAVGPAAHEVSGEFERFWQSASAYPLAQVLPAGAVIGLSAAPPPLAQQLVDPGLSPQAQAYLQAVKASGFVSKLLARELPLEWVRVQLMTDDPEKALGHMAESSLLYARLQRAVGEPKSAFYLVSPYFVPTQQGYDWLAGMRRNGVEVKVLTNSLESTDVLPVHAGYARWREPLLATGVQLFEIRRTPTSRAAHAHASLLGKSGGESLHAKTFAVDREMLFVGSFNFDPRSARLNTEIGLLIHSPRLATHFVERFNLGVPEQAYETRLGPAQQLQWLDASAGAPGQPEVFTQEPHVGFWRRLYVRFLQMLPLESEL